VTPIIERNMNPQPPSGHAFVVELVLPSEPDEARRLLESLEAELRARTVPDRDIFSIVMALEEALINAMKHGNQLDPTKKVHVTYRIEQTVFEVHIRDEGPGFDPSDVPDPTDVENLERPCGRGLLMMRYYMSEVRYNETGNAVFMQRHFSPA
jgi:serine/threonine-protein kinase RsbW